MNVKVATEIIKFCGDICGHMDCKKARGFLEGHVQASKAAEALLELIEKQRKALEFCSQPAGAFSRDHHQHAKNCLEESMKIAQEALSSSAQVVENYRKEVLGE